MAVCQLCGKKGFFLRLGQHGLCKDCEIKLLEIPDRIRLINESIDIVSQSNNAETVLSRIQFEKMQVNEISRIAAGKIDPLLLLGYDCSLSEIADNIYRLCSDTEEWVDAIFDLIKEQLDENGPMPLKDIVSFFEENPDYWSEKYDISKSIRSLLEQRGELYEISKEKIKNKYYYYMDGQEEMIEQIQNETKPRSNSTKQSVYYIPSPNPQKLYFSITSNRLPPYPDYDVLSDLEFAFMEEFERALSDALFDPKNIEICRLSDGTFNVIYSEKDGGCYVGKINLKPGISSPDKYAVMKNGQKRAKRVLDSEEEAKTYMEQHGGDYIEYRPGHPALYYMQYLSGENGVDIHTIQSSDFQDYIDAIPHWIDYIKECQKPIKYN